MIQLIIMSVFGIMLVAFLIWDYVQHQRIMQMLDEDWNRTMAELESQLKERNKK